MADFNQECYTKYIDAIFSFILYKRGIKVGIL